MDSTFALFPTREAAAGITNLHVVLVDRSYAVTQTNTKAARALEEVNGYLFGLSSDPSSASMLAVVIGFDEDLTTLIPPFRLDAGLRVQRLNRSQKQAHLARSVGRVLGELRQGAKLDPELNRTLKTTVAVFSDGRDASGDAEKALTREDSFQAQELGWKLILFRLYLHAKDDGPNASRIARLLGFPTDKEHAIDLERRRRSSDHEHEKITHPQPRSPR